MMGYHEGIGWWMLWGGLMMVLFWAGLLLAVYWVFRSINSARRGVSSPGQRVETAMDIADRRLASGEIDGDEYDSMVSRMKSGA